MEDLGGKSARGGHKTRPSAIGAVAARQDALITRAQLRGCGLSGKQIRSRVANGYLHPLYDGVFLVGVGKPSRQARLRGALLATREGSFLSGRTAAALLGVRPLNLSAIEVTVVGATEQRPPLVVHRTRTAPPRDEIRLTNRLRHSSFTRVLVELSARETEAELTRLVEEGVRRNLFFIHKVETALSRHARRPGIANLQGPLRYYLDRSDRKSWLERAFDRELQRRPYVAVPERNVLLEAGGIVWEIDCLWREHGVILELDGRPWHVCERDLEKDKLKDMKLAALGHVPVRVTARRFERDADGVFADVEELLAVRRAA
jgi:hypothetical protein